MRESLNDPVNVLAIYSHKTKHFRPLMMTWRNMDYRLGQVDFYHTTKQGSATLHHFSLATKDETVYFKLLFNAHSLNWTLEEYMMAGETAAVYSQPA